MATAVGCIGMSLDDFCRCTPLEFQTIYEAWMQRENLRDRTSWEQTRHLCCCLLQPYSRRRIRPSDVLRFPWDNENAPSETSDRAMTGEEVRHRFEIIKKERGLS